MFRVDGAGGSNSILHLILAYALIIGKLIISLGTSVGINSDQLVSSVTFISVPTPNWFNVDSARLVTIRISLLKTS